MKKILKLKNGNQVYSDGKYLFVEFKSGHKDAMYLRYPEEEESKEILEWMISKK